MWLPSLIMVVIPLIVSTLSLGVDRILDMCRTVLNVTGDLVTATVVARVEGIRPPGETPSPA